ncbi:virulence protein RhuM/Fic/DOC family protein [Chromohalobacter israelensis]|uniref:virulence protein RhuM/Fic/DOC family protein n=1 Tax=Chromohalobacter israelensis TaxID=141390 RepID=UPI00054DD8B1|nr:MULTISPECIES: virulence protein RhuM/Fic/DOC family protein [Chromohalobacter]MBZ5877440.1 virulence protein RhuM/Fic/DOC family protein [Chromohalobacter salexigens]MDF9436034.1 virulence protein RhuM/Fic/DOC family protein [Chromohalobacter israelensis]PWW35006.1 Fic/DOC family protein [Chromohalobacter salexigens]
MSEQPQILIYEDADKAVDVRLDEGRETVWLTQRQMAELFDKDVRTVNEHVLNVYEEGELEREPTIRKFRIVRQEGSRQVMRAIEHYNLDVIISVGYRVKSQAGTRFRQWATRVLREHLIQGWTLHQQRFEANAQELEAAMALVRKAAHSPALNMPGSRGLVDIVARYAQTFLLLQRYDEGLLSDPDVQAGGQLPSLETARATLDELKAELIGRGEATDLFARDRSDGLASLLGNLDQSIFGEPAYPSIESKAAHLLYFVIKNHPFADGNKRSAAFLFVDFLHRNDRLLSSTGEPVINDVGLAALTLLVAESDPANKETMIRLIMNMLADDAAST